MRHYANPFFVYWRRKVAGKLPAKKKLHRRVRVRGEIFKMRGGNLLKMILGVERGITFDAGKRHSFLGRQIKFQTVLLCLHDGKGRLVLGLERLLWLRRGSDRHATNIWFELQHAVAIRRLVTHHTYRKIQEWPDNLLHPAQHDFNDNATNKTMIASSNNHRMRTISGGFLVQNSYCDGWFSRKRWLKKYLSFDQLKKKSYF